MNSIQSTMLCIPQVKAAYELIEILMPPSLPPNMNSSQWTEHLIYKHIPYKEIVIRVAQGREGGGGRHAGAFRDRETKGIYLYNAMNTSAHPSYLISTLILNTIAQ